MLDRYHYYYIQLFVLDYYFLSHKDILPCFMAEKPINVVLFNSRQREIIDSLKRKLRGHNPLRGS